MKEVLSLIIPSRFGWNGSLQKHTFPGKVNAPKELSLPHMVWSAIQLPPKEEVSKWSGGLYTYDPI